MSRSVRQKSNTLPAIFLCVMLVLLLPLVGYIVYLQIVPPSEDGDIKLSATSVPSVFTEDPAQIENTPTPIPFEKLIAPAEETPEPHRQFDAFSDRFWKDGKILSETEYRSPSLSVIYRRVYDTETFHKRLTYYTAEVFVQNIEQIKTASCKGSFEKIGHGSVEKTAKENHALLAISGDYYGFHGSSLVIRNGITYRTSLRKGDICLLLRDGTMETIRGADANINLILEKDPWQGWQFGPELMTGSGEAKSGFVDSNLSVDNPRSCIGYVEPGHYFFVVVDGRQKNSRGLSLIELAQLMESLGCVQAYNLDGGASAHFFWDDRIVNNPCGGGRQISDIIYLEKESYRDSPLFPRMKGLTK